MRYFFSASSKTPKLDTTDLFKGLDRPASDELVIKATAAPAPTPVSSTPPEVVETIVDESVAPAPIVEPTPEPTSEQKEEIVPVMTTTSEEETTKPVELTITAPTIHIDIPTSESPTKKQHSNSHSTSTPKLPCLTCTGEKEEDTNVESRPVEKLDAETTPVVVDAAATDLLVVDVKTPPKKPPRGLVDVDIDASSPVGKSKKSDDTVVPANVVAKVEIGKLLIKLRDVCLCVCVKLEISNAIWYFKRLGK